MEFNRKELLYLAYVLDRNIRILENLDQDIDPYLYKLKDKILKNIKVM